MIGKIIFAIILLSFIRLAFSFWVITIKDNDGALTIGHSLILVGLCVMTATILATA